MQQPEPERYMVRWQVPCLVGVICFRKLYPAVRTIICNAIEAELVHGFWRGDERTIVLDHWHGIVLRSWHPLLLPRCCPAVSHYEVLCQSLMRLMDQYHLREGTAFETAAQFDS